MEEKPTTDETHGQNHPRWRAPVMGWYKANWDVGIDRANERLGVGIVVRNSEGLVMGAKSITKPGLFYPTSAEAVGAPIDARFCKDLDIQDLILEGDALLVVKEISNAEGSGTRFGHIVADIN